MYIHVRVCAISLFQEHSVISRSPMTSVSIVRPSCSAKSERGHPLQFASLPSVGVIFICVHPVSDMYIVHVHVSVYMRISMNHNSLGCEQPSRPRCRTITQCAGHVSANARPLQLCWGDRECGCFTPCTYNTDGWPY